MAATTMHFGPEWMRTKHQPVSKPQAPSPPPSSTQSASSTYSALVSTIPGVENDKHDDTHPFRYTKEELLRIYKESPKGGLGLEVERWEGVVREIGAEPVALREMGEAERKLFSGPLNSDLRRRQSTDYLSLNTTSLGTERPRLNLNPGSATASPLRERHPVFKRRDSTADSPTMPRKQSLSSLQAPNIGSRTAALPSPRSRPGYPSFDGVLNTGDTWTSRRRASEASSKPGSVARQLSGEYDVKGEGIQEEVDGVPSSDALGNSDPSKVKQSASQDAQSANGFTDRPNSASANASGKSPTDTQDLSIIEWSYKDPMGNIQGPFPAKYMQKWYDDGYFTLDLPMKRTHLDAEWMTLDELIKRATIVDKIFLCTLLSVNGAPPGLARRNGSPSQVGTGQGDNAFSNPYQPTAHPLLNPTLDSLNGSNPSDSPASNLGHFGTSSPDPLAFGNRANLGYGGDANLHPFSGGVDMTPLRHRQVPEYMHESPLRLHSPFTNVIGNHSLDYGYPGFNPVQTSPWAPPQNYPNYNHGAGFVANSFGTSQGYIGHNPTITTPINPLVYGNADVFGQHPQIQTTQNAQGYFDPIPGLNDGVNTPKDAYPPLNQHLEQYQQPSPGENKADVSNATATLDGSQTAKVQTLGEWDEPLGTLPRRSGPFDAGHPTTLNTSVPAASSQSSPWGQPTVRTTVPGSEDPSPRTAVAQSILEPAAASEPSVPLVHSEHPPVSPSTREEKGTPSELIIPSSSAEVPESAGAQPQPSPSKAKGKPKKSLISPPSPPPVIADIVESPVSAQAKSPWAKPDKKKGKGPVTYSLREIQDAESKAAEARKAEREQDRVRLVASAASSNGSKDDIQHFTASWGLPTSQTGTRTTSGQKDPLASPQPPSVTPPVWTNAVKVATTKKTMKEIQEEEEARKTAAAKEPVATVAVKRGYAEHATKISPVPPPIAVPATGGAWVTVGASGKTSAPTTATPARPPATVIASVPVNHASPSIKPSVIRTAAAVARPAVIPGKIDDFPISPSHEFLKWLSESLKGLNSTANVEEIISMLLSFSLDPDSTTMEIISDTIYANSTTLDGRRFASEFVAKRKTDVVNKSKGASAAKSAGKPISIAEVVKATPKAAQAEWGFKVVNKKKKGGRS
ncbi:hypothetical protein FA15DRAFT_608163 [Coprinopsis marcescibilis]|uniref:GYF domain-containing protein n=1 Tax=Coprinopsis marcescibilis TaxID=230819 RepID=A0A5C3LFQ0_COPMA|nr:hypothetical protein FA15DRAFT_608163 [Coprinopsis marcescibilis]